MEQSLLPILSKALKKKYFKKFQNTKQSIELSLIFSIPASFGLILASEQIVNALFGYGSFIEENIQKTALALKYFAYGVPAFALIKILSNFFLQEIIQKHHFIFQHINVTLNIIISFSFLIKVGFIIIPIATSVSTWLGVFIYIYLLNKKNGF